MKYEQKIVDRQVGRNADLFALTIGELKTPEERYGYVRILISIIEQAHPEWNQAPNKDKQIAHLIFHMSRGGVPKEETEHIVQLRDEERGFTNHLRDKENERRKAEAAKAAEEEAAAEDAAVEEDADGGEDAADSDEDDDGEEEDGDDAADDEAEASSDDNEVEAEDADEDDEEEVEEKPKKKKKPTKKKAAKKKKDDE